ncbi:unnamed protein product [Gordionus sp. m RMFG-2023]
MRTKPNREYCVISSTDTTVAGEEADKECMGRGYDIWTPKTAEELIFWADNIGIAKHKIEWRIGYRFKDGIYYNDDGSLGRINFPKDYRFTMVGEKEECLFLKKENNIRFILQRPCQTVANFICTKKTKFVNEDCRDNNDCWIGGNMICQNGKCQCLDNNSPALTACESKNQRYCVQTRYGKDSCQPGQCGRGLNCSVLKENHNGTCECLPNFVKDPDKDKDYICYEPIQLGKPCETTKECEISDPLSYCAEISFKSVCKCIGESYFLSGKCLNRSAYNETCSTTEHCQNPIMKCVSGKCVCNDGYYHRQDMCVKGKAYNETCSDDEECSATHKYYHCSHNATFIPTQIFYMHNTNFFIKSLSSSFQHKPGKSLILISKKCYCIPTATYKFDTCVLASNNHSCISDADCKDMPQSVCTTHNICMCSKGYILRGNSTGCVKGIEFGADCISDSECDYQGGACVDKKCACDSSFFLSDGTCHKRISFHNPCTKDDDCKHMAINTKCLKGECKCNKGYYDERYRECLPDRIFGAYCDHKEQCRSIGSGVACLYATCDCNLGMYKDKDKCVMGKTLGTTCDNDIQCNKMVQASGCIRSKCACENKEINDTLYTCLPGKAIFYFGNHEAKYVFDSYDCAINIKFETDPPLGFEDKLVRIKYVETLFFKKFSAVFAHMFVRLNMAHEKNSHYHISMIIYLNDSLGIRVVDLITTHTTNNTYNVLANGDVIEIKAETFHLLPIKGDCFKLAIEMVPERISDTILFAVAAILFLVVLLSLLLIFTSRYSKYNPRVDYPWRYNSALPPPFVPSQRDMIRCLEKARRLPWSVRTGKVDMNYLKRIYMNYFYRDYYDYDYGYSYDLAYKYASDMDPEIETLMIEIYTQDEIMYYPLKPGDIHDDVEEAVLYEGEVQTYEKNNYYEEPYEYGKALSDYEYQYQYE